MNLYFISQVKNDNWDTYDSAVVCAETEERARLTHPSRGDLDEDPRDYSDWAAAEYIKVELIGTSNIDRACVVCASFNAG